MLADERRARHVRGIATCVHGAPVHQEQAPGWVLHARKVILAEERVAMNKVGRGLQGTRRDFPILQRLGQFVTVAGAGPPFKLRVQLVFKGTTTVHRGESFVSQLSPAGDSDQLAPLFVAEDRDSAP